MVTADCRAVSVAEEEDDMLIRPLEFDACRECQRPAVRRLDAVEIGVGRRFGRAANAGNGDYVVLVDLQFGDSPQRGFENDAVTAPGTPYGGKSVVRK